MTRKSESMTESYRSSGEVEMVAENGRFVLGSCDWGVYLHSLYGRKPNVRYLIHSYENST